MPEYKYLIIGGGMTADAAVRGIREADPQGAIGLIGDEPHPPYNRPPLSKGLWKGKPLDGIWRRTPPENLTLHLGRRAVALDPKAKVVADDQGTTYRYQRLLLATGGSPRRLPFGADQIIYYRNLDDYHRLRTLADKAQRFAVIGGGFIGSEMAAALKASGKEVRIIFPEIGIGARVFPADLSMFLNDYYRERGVVVVAEQLAGGLETRDTSAVLKVRDAKSGLGWEIMVDGIVAGLGLQPNAELAKAAGLTIGDGIAVDEYLRTSQPEIYAAGDVAEFPSALLGTRMRVEHEDNANRMGKTAGQNMAGGQIAYRHQPYFYSDLFDLGYEAVGQLDSRLETVSDWQEPFHKGVVYYLREGKVRGVLLWNVWGKVESARALLAEPGPFQPSEFMGRLAG
jgi:NADPH-dependent 2,4-dienoyl-CoA reductase/sulfur reductase-like enzyme